MDVVQFYGALRYSLGMEEEKSYYIHKSHELNVSDAKVWQRTIRPPTGQIPNAIMDFPLL